MMNYVGSISILDRGDAPAQAIIDRNARSLAQRVADETKQELEKVMTRVENIYESYESSTQALFETQANLEYVEDIAELEELIKDQLKKKKYQQQVTIFIVGYENVCGQKLKLLQQVNEFFMDNSKSYEEEDWYPKTPDIDLDDCGNKIEETIHTAKELTERLGELNSEMVEWLTSYAINKASSKGKKKLETALSKAKDDIKTITEQLKGAQAANDEKEDLLNTYLKQLEGKTIEVQKFKAAAEVAKKNIQDMENKEVLYKDEMERRDNTIREMSKKLQQVEMDLNQTNFMQNLNSNRLKDKTNEYQDEAIQQEIRLEELQTQVDKGKFVVEEAKRELQVLHEKQLFEIQESHGKEIEELKAAHQEELKKAQQEVLETQQQLIEAELEAQLAVEQADKIRQDLFELQLRGSPADARAADTLDGGEGDDGTPRDDSRLESRPSTKDTKSSRSTAGKGPSRITTQVKVTAKPTTKEAKSTSKPHKDTADTAVQDEGGDPNSAHVETRQSKRTRSTLETVKESELSGDYGNTFELTDEDAWSAVPAEHIPGRFIQYRKLTQRKLLDLEDQLNLTVAKTQRKVNTLKSQFQEHKGKWEAERKVLIEQVEQAQKLQTEAEKEADVAMTQLEEFINEQERLEEEEEVKRQEVVRSVNSVNAVLPSATNVHDIATQVDSQRGSSPQTVTPVEGLIEGQREPLTTREPTSEQVENVPEAAPQHVQTEDSEQELSKLMQQTDDAKAQEINSRITSGAMSAPPAVEESSRSGSDTKDKINISGKTEEEIRTSSALSRASLRNQYRNKLGEVRAAVEDRRAKSPAISLPSQRSLGDDQLVEDEDDLPFTDEVKELKVKEYSMDIGTSPPPGALKDQKQVNKESRASSVVDSDHPVVGEYLRAYEGVIHFRNALSKLMLDREMLQPSQILADIDTVGFNKETNVEPQLEKMTDNLYHVLEEVISVLGAILLADREPMVSSLTGGLLMSRDGTQHYPHPDRVSADSGRGPTVTRASQHSSKATPYSATSDKLALRELQEQYERLKIQFTEEGRKHEEQLRHNTVVMMEMQDTINDLQRELTNLGRSSSRLRPNSDIASPQDSAIMFTRLDSERNAKIMKRAVNDQKMDSEKYKDAINKMDDYVSLPAQRLAHLVRKYVHHCRMKEIEENVKKSRSLNENVFEILDKMEALQNQRAKKWADRMDEMGAERLRLANLLMETLDSIEQESGIFLIKPMYSYRGRDVKDTRFGGKLTRPLRPQRHMSPNRELNSVFAPAPTPASNVRSLVKHAPLQAHYQQPVPPEQLAVKSGPVQPLEGDETGVTGAAMNWVGTAAARQTWSLNSSVVRGDSEAGLANHMNTPRILELDINRMLIGQNTISSKMSQQGVTEDRLVNASQNNLRSYITVNRPTASPSQPRQPSMTFFSSTTKEFVPPSSPASTANTTKRVRMSDVDIPRNIPSTPPLPPIPTGSAGSTHETLGEPPRSPPGSSLRQTPPHVQEVISPLK